jgi:hypothetical protein
LWVKRVGWSGSRHLSSSPICGAEMRKGGALEKLIDVKGMRELFRLQVAVSSSAPALGSELAQSQ